MPIVDMKDMIQHAYQHGYAVGSFDLTSLEFLEGIIAAAERCRSPVILSLAESNFDYFDIELLMPAVETAARRSTVPVAIHLDQGTNLASAVRAINLGCNGVMVDASHLPLYDNIRCMYAVANVAHACGVPVEGKLEYVSGLESKDTRQYPRDTAYITVEETRAYVEQTNVDFLAIAIGSEHNRIEAEPKPDFHRLKEINATLNIPLVIDGGTGLSEDQFQHLISNGVAKINYFTALADVAGTHMLNISKADQNSVYTSLIKGVKDTISIEVERCMRLGHSAERADQLLSHCTPWAPVEHLIIYNVAGINEQETRAMMAEGQKVLSSIPGVREVVIGHAIKKEASYRYTWLVRFCHPDVIESYRNHTAHIAFADNLFRPVAGERISIDYQTIEPTSDQKNFTKEK